jgi:ATPase subunit of ABC transporter with duplicated ATPase domains
MLSIHVRRLAFAYSDATSVLSEVDFHLGPGWYGLVGASGAGKSTLLRLLAGELAPDDGSVRVEPDDAVVSVCPQLVDEPSDDVLALAGAIDAVALRLRAALELDDCRIAEWATLSPGERKRWQIGASLRAEPDVLLLDEPTNHVDAVGRELLLTGLRRFRGVGVVVSHDRELLEALTTTTLRVHEGRVAMYAGAYAAARRSWQADEQAASEARQHAQAHYRTATRRLADARRDLASAERSLRAGSRMKGRHDHDARGALAKGRAARAEKAIGRMVGVRREEALRAAAAIEPGVADKTLGRSVFVNYDFPKAERLLAIDSDVVRVGERVLFRNVHLALRRGDRIRLEGPNGAGKTTLVRALIAAARVDRDRLLYLPQDLAQAAQRELLGTIRRLERNERGRVLSLVAALGVNPERLLASEEPSPGEARKVMIALGLGRHAWALVLDEPTNHLDLPSIERLEAALDDFPGALLLVSHDVGFARRCTSVAWRLDHGAIRLE